MDVNMGSVHLKTGTAEAVLSSNLDLDLSGNAVTSDLPGLSVAQAKGKLRSKLNAGGKSLHGRTRGGAIHLRKS